MKKIFFVGIFILITLCTFSDEVVRYVNTDSTAGGTGITNATTGTDRAYPTLTDWESNEQTDLVSAGDWMHVYASAPSGVAETAQVVISGWTADATNYILIEAADGDQAIKTGWDASRYRIVTSTNCIVSQETYTYIKGLQMEVTAGTSACVFWGTAGVGRIYNNRMRGTGTGTRRGINNSSSGTISVWNNIIYDLTDGINAGNGTVFIYNNTIYNSSADGFEIEASGTSTLVHNAIFNNADDFDLAGGSTNTLNYNASDDGDGSNPISPSGADWDNEFTDLSTDNVTLLNTGNLYHGGTTGPDTGLYTTDIEGDAFFASAYSIGVDEFVSAGGNAPTADLQGPLVGPLGGPLMYRLFICYSLITTLLLGYTYIKLLGYKKKQLFYSRNENIQALAELNKYLDGGNYDRRL